MTEQMIIPGVVICPGLGIGQVVLLDTDAAVPKHQINSDQIRDEQHRYMKAAHAARRHVSEHLKATHYDMPEQSSSILVAHSAILKDKGFHDHVCDRIASDFLNAEWALETEALKLMALFEAMRDPLFRARTEDIRDMATSILDLLVQDEEQQAPSIQVGTGHVIATPHLHPSAAMLAQRTGVAGFASESRAQSSHAAILLKGCNIPSLASVDGLIQSAQHGDIIIVDALDGQVILRPKKEVLAAYEERVKAFRGNQKVVPPIQCHTADGTEVRLQGNIGNPGQVSLILQKGLQGIGLFRTEFFALEGGHIPEEDAQVEIYKGVLQRLSGRPLVIRTFDIGADKQAGNLSVPTRQNPALGVRGIRRHLQGCRAELEMQYRAILRAAEGFEISIMIPMVTTLNDIQQAKRYLAKVKAVLDASNTPYARTVRFGAMIETPAAALIVADILDEVDFISLGTNDLLQYLMAADRDNEDVIDYNDPKHPAFRMLLEHIIKEAIRLDRQNDVSICGEIASRRNQIPSLLNMGYRSFSVSPVMADEIRGVIAETNLKKNLMEHDRHADYSGEMEGSRICATRQ